MKGICAEVAGDYPLYEQLLLGSKLTEGADIFVSDLKPSNAKWLVHRMPVAQLAVPSYRSELHTEVSIKEDGNFKFLLFARRFMPTPLANYDAKGATHRNEREGVPLVEQAITTPHFNRYDNHGKRIAYKTDILKDPELSKQVEDIAHCVFHFYNEFNIRHQPAGYPNVAIRPLPQQDLFTPAVSDDPLAYAQF